MSRKRKKNFWGEAKVGAIAKRKPTPCKNCGLDRYLDEDGLCYTTCSPTYKWKSGQSQSSSEPTSS